MQIVSPRGPQRRRLAGLLLAPCSNDAAENQFLKHLTQDITVILSTWGSCKHRNTFVVHCSCVSPPFFFLSLFSPFLQFSLSTVLGFNHCCNWQLPAVQTHACTHAHTHSYSHTVAAASPSGNVLCVCVLWGQKRGRYGEIRIMKEGEFQNCRPTHQSVCCEALWGSGATQPNFNYLRGGKKWHGRRFITEHNIVFEFPETRMLPRLSQINNWPCHMGRRPSSIYKGTDACTVHCLWETSCEFTSAGIPESLIRPADQHSTNSSIAWMLVRLTG